MTIRFRRPLLLALAIAALLATSSRLPADTGTCGGGMTTLLSTDVAGSSFFCQIAEAFYSGLPTGRLHQLTARPTTLLASRWRRSSRGLSTRRCGGAAVGLLSSNGPLRLGYQASFLFLESRQMIRSDGRGSLWMTSGTSADGQVLRWAPGAEGFTQVITFSNPFGLLFWQNELFVTTKSKSRSPLVPYWCWSGSLERNRRSGNQPIGITTDGTYIWTANFGGFRLADWIA